MWLERRVLDPRSSGDMRDPQSRTVSHCNKVKIAKGLQIDKLDSAVTMNTSEVSTSLSPSQTFKKRVNFTDITIKALFNQYCIYEY